MKGALNYCCRHLALSVFGVCETWMHASEVFPWCYHITVVHFHNLLPQSNLAQADQLEVLCVCYTFLASVILQLYSGLRTKVKVIEMTV